MMVKAAALVVLTSALVVVLMSAVLVVVTPVQFIGGRISPPIWGSGEKTMHDYYVHL